MTTASRAVQRLISYSWDDWWVSMDEQRAAMAVLRTDTDLAATIRDLISAGVMYDVVHRLPALEVAQLLGGGCDAASRSSIRSAITRSSAVASGGTPSAAPQECDTGWLFDLSFEIQDGMRRLGASFSATPFNESSFAAVIPGAADAPFSGVGATGVPPSRLSIGPVDQARMLAGDREVSARYSNPLGSLTAYLAGLSPTVRRQQAQLLVSRPICSLVPHSYASRLPSRAGVFSLAGGRHRLDPALVAAFVLAEQRDQTRLEDAKDLIAARSLARGNTSIGLGQIVVSTARREDSFSDLLSSAYRSSLSHESIALLLTSDELNIFGVAKYVRTVANRAAGLSLAALPATAAEYPGLNLGRFASHSSAWPDDNIRALGSEYTSGPWDDALVPAWGEFVYQAWRDMRASGLFPP
jgi:hypothetical protein